MDLVNQDYTSFIPKRVRNYYKWIPHPNKSQGNIQIRYRELPSMTEKEAEEMKQRFRDYVNGGSYEVSFDTYMFMTDGITVYFNKKR